MSIVFSKQGVISNFLKIKASIQQGMAMGILNARLKRIAAGDADSKARQPGDRPLCVWQ